MREMMNREIWDQDLGVARRNIGWLKREINTVDDESFILQKFASYFFFFFFIRYIWVYLDM